MAAGKGYNHVPAGLEYLTGGGSGSRRPVKMVWHDQLANSSLPCCKYGSIDLLEKKIVSNSLIELQDIWVKDFINIALA